MDRHLSYRFDDFRVDTQAWRLCRDGREIHLEPIVLKLLIYLISKRERLVTRRELMETVWSDTVISDAALSKAMARLRKALEDDPVAPRYIQTVHSRGYRFMAEVEEQPPGSGVSVSRGARRSRANLILIVVTVAAALALLSLLWPETRDHGTPPMNDTLALAVLPLENLTGDPEQDYFVDGLQDSLVTGLAQLGAVRVTSRQSTVRYRGSDQPLPDIADELGVDMLVEGSVLRTGERVEVNLQLVDGRNDEHLWAQRYTRDASLVFDLSAEAANAIGSALGLQAVIRPTGAIDTRAIQAYWQGLAQMEKLSQQSIQAAIARLRAATELEPGFGLAWGNLAAAHLINVAAGGAPALESIELARSAALNAVEADSHNYIGHSALGYVKLLSGDLEGACAAFRKALQLNPSARWAIHGEADCLMLDGQLDESVERLRELQMISPFAFVDSFPLTFHLLIARDYDAAIDTIHELEERFPGYPARLNLSLVYWAQGDFAAAVQEERLKLEQRGDVVLLSALDAGLAAGGPRDAMRAVADALVERSGSSYVDPFEIGKTYAHAGAVDEAIDWLEKAVEQRSFEIIHMVYRPDLDVLRSDPRFQELVRKVNPSGPGLD
jgi:TolB-like protein/DNA-binding winged helix-turn-helix (wHTH) protein